MDEFNLKGREYIALCKLLQLTGISPSGGTAKMLIADGQVKVDGQVELRKRCKIKAGQVVEYDARQVKLS